MIVPLSMLLVAALVNAQSAPATTTDAGTTTVAAGTTDSAAGTTTGAADGSTTAGASTTAGGDSTAASTVASGATTEAGATGVTCTTDECCKKLESGTQPCTTCAKSTGCTFYGLFNNNVFTLGGKCVLTSANVEVPTGHKKIEKFSECADLCKGVSCTGCLAITECKWCDTGAATVGVSTGSCELAKCNTGVTPKTSCPSSAAATAFSVAAAAVAAVFML